MRAERAGKGQFERVADKFGDFACVVPYEIVAKPSKRFASKEDRRWNPCLEPLEQPEGRSQEEASQAAWKAARLTDNNRQRIRDLCQVRRCWQQLCKGYYQGQDRILLSQRRSGWQASQGREGLWLVVSESRSSGREISALFLKNQLTQVRCKIGQAKEVMDSSRCSSLSKEKKNGKIAIHLLDVCLAGYLNYFALRQVIMVTKALGGRKYILLFF